LGSENSENVWLVGAFCKFGQLDTGNPVQIYGHIWILAALPEF